MSSKVRNTFTVLMISALTLGLFAATPAMLPVVDIAAAQSSEGFAATAEADAARVADEVLTTTLIAEAPVMVGLAATLQDTTTAPAAVQTSRHKSGKSRRIRQSMAMPFFSFAPRG